MDNAKCRKCLIKKVTRNNCRDKAEDGFAIRCGQPWASHKHKPVIVYSEMLTIGMRRKWGEINYIDLFAGPGKYYERTTGKLMDGSPAIAARYSYSKLYLNDIEQENIDALKFRFIELSHRCQFYTEDANDAAKKINISLPANSLNFCFADPSNMNDLKYETISNISRGKRVDLLINFAYGSDFRRSTPHSKEKKNKKLDQFFGTDEWRTVNDNVKCKKTAFRAEALIDLYMRQLNKIEYAFPPEGKEYLNYFPIYNSRRGLLYYLIFASKHSMGYDFCKKMRKSALKQSEFDLS